MKTFYLKATLLMFLLIGLMLASASCSIKKPEAPSWETTWDLPLTSKTYSFEDILAELDSTEIQLDTLGNPYFSIIQEIDTIAVENNLTAPGISQTYNDSLGVIDIDPPVVPSSNFAIGDLVDPAYLGLGQIPVDTNFTIDEALSSFSNFSVAEIYQGSLVLEVVNDLGFNIDSLVITIYNKVDLDADPFTTPLGVANFESGVLDNQTISRSVDLAGKLLKNQLTLRVYGAVDSQGINLPSNNLTVNSSFPAGLSVSSATAKLPSISPIDLNQTIDLGDSSIIYQATVETGSMTLNIANATNLPLNISLSIPNFEYLGSPLTVDTSLTGNTSINHNVNLAGYVFTPDGSTTPQTISINASAAINTDSSTMYAVNSSDSIKITADVSSITFESVMGRIQPTEITIDPMVQDIDMPDGFDNAHLTHAELRMYLYNNSTTDVLVDFQLQNNYGSNITASNIINGKPLVSSEIEVTEIILGGDSLSAFLNPAPSQITIAGSAILNPNNADSVTISSADFFYGEVEIYSPLAFALDSASTLDLEITDIEMNPDDMPDFNETFVYGNINATLTNRLPVGASVTLYLSTLPTVFNDPNAIVIGPFTLESAVTDANGYSIEEVVSTFDDSLTTDDIAIFDNTLIYIAPKVELLPTGVNGSIIQGSDYISINASVRLRIKAGDHLWDNNNY